MKLSLVAIHIKESTRAIPLGPAMLASALKKHLGAAVQTSIINLYLNQNIEECLKRIMADKPDYVGLSIYMWNRDMMLAIAAKLKRRHPEIVIFAGGPEAGADSENIRRHNCIDFILKGESEDLIVSTFKALLEDNLKTETADSDSAQALPDLETLPSPYLDGTLDLAKYPGLLWELSRGCIFKCDFCYESRGNHCVRRFPLERIKAELRLFGKHDIEQIFILDPTFNCDQQRAKEILRLIRKTAPNIHYFIEIRSEFVDEEMARLFSSISCSLQIGMQSADPEVLKNVSRTIKRDDFKKKIQLLDKAGVTYGFDLIIALPGDTLDGFRRSLDFAMSMEPNHIDIFVLSVLPGTRLCENAASFGIEYMPNNPYKVISTPLFSNRDIQKAERLSEAFDLFYCRGKAVPWFNIVTQALKIKPSEFFEAFGIWLDSGAGDRNDDIITLQRHFLEHIFKQRTGKETWGAIASDIAAYFGHTARIIEDCDDHIDESVAATYILNPLSSFADFSHNPLELAQHLFSGVTAFSDFEKLLKSKPYTTLLFQNAENEIDIRFLSGDKLEMLKQARTGIMRLPHDTGLKYFARTCMEEGILIDRSTKPQH